MSFYIRNSLTFKELCNHFNNSLTNLKFKNKKIPVNYNDDDGQMLLKGGSVNNNIKIKNKDLDNGILRVRYMNNRKLTNNHKFIHNS